MRQKEPCAKKRHAPKNAALKNAPNLLKLKRKALFVYEGLGKVLGNELKQSAIAKQGNRAKQTKVAATTLYRLLSMNMNDVYTSSSCAFVDVPL